MADTLCAGLMHWPAPMTKDGKPDKERDWLDTWKDMERVYKAHPEKVKAIGVSNFSVPYLKRLLESATVIPAVNQIESHPYVLSEVSTISKTRAHTIA